MAAYFPVLNDLFDAIEDAKKLQKTMMDHNPFNAALQIATKAARNEKSAIGLLMFAADFFFTAQGRHVESEAAFVWGLVTATIGQGEVEWIEESIDVQ